MSNPIIDEAVKRFDDEFMAVKEYNYQTGEAEIYPDRFASRANLPKYIKDFLISELTTAIKATRESVVEKLWELCHMVEERLERQKSVEGYPPMEAVDVVAMVNTLLTTIKEEE